MALSLTVAVMLLTACGKAGPSATCGDLPRIDGTSKVLQEMELQAFGAVTVARDEPGLSAATVVSEIGVQKLVKPVRAAIDKAGYTVLAEENDGFEADFKFNRGSQVYGIARITDDPSCGVRQIQVSVAETAS